MVHQLKADYVFLEVRPPLVTEVQSISTSQMFNIIQGLLGQKTFLDKLIYRNTLASFEIVSTKEKGIRYVLRIRKDLAKSVERNLRSYIPGMKIERVEDYLAKDFFSYKVTEYKYLKHFSYPLNENTDLKKHDPLAYLAGAMTQLELDEMMAMQIVLKPVGRLNVRKIKKAKDNNQFTNQTQYIFYLFVLAVESLVRIIMIPLLFLSEFAGGNSSDPLPRNSKTILKSDSELEEPVKSKLSQVMFEGSVRTLLISGKRNIDDKEKGLRASFSSFIHETGQTLIARKTIIKSLLRWQFVNRLSLNPIILSSAEVGAMYHFPHTANNQTEDLLRVRSKELPAPLYIKNNKNFDVVFGKNHFGNTTCDIGLTDDDRSRHVYLIGQTGSGKSTIIYHMASDDIKKERGLAVVDPHGDLAEGLLDTIPDKRTDDVIYFNPFDIKYPVGINLLELNEDLDEDEIELEKELVCESVVSIFRRVFFKDESTDAHRIEYILRNAIYTAFTLPNRTIFTVYDLLNDNSFRKSAIKYLQDENLIKFWKNEFGKAGDYQHVKMVSGVTSKVGRFLFSPIAKRILEQPKSTINFDDILNNGKVLLCNLAEGKLGEDTSMLLGATVIAKVHQASVRRARISSSNRKPFYLFVDEFQNFATSSFTKLLSGGRKFGLRITIAEQSTSQQDNKNITNVVLANTGTVICFRTASPVDEEIMLSQFAPTVQHGDIGNLPRYHFYMRLAAIEPEAPFSGITIPIVTETNQAKKDFLIESSRKNYAIEYGKKAGKPAPIPIAEKPVKDTANEQETVKNAGQLIS